MEKGKDIPNRMHSSREQQGEIKKAFFNEQCKEIEENHRMGKTRDLFRKIRDTKGTFLTRMEVIKEMVRT